MFIGNMTSGIQIRIGSILLKFVNYIISFFALLSRYFVQNFNPPQRLNPLVLEFDGDTYKFFIQAV